MSRDPALYLDDIIEAIDVINGYMAGVSHDHFFDTRLIQDAVLRRIAIIGEAAQHLPRQLTDRYPAIPWVDIVGMRNRVIHGYFVVSLDRIWNVIHHDLPVLRQAIEELRDEHGSC